MSNHSGSYMLNEVLELLEKNGVFKFLGEDKTENFISKIIRLSDRHDCNPGEILEGIGERLGFCRCCANKTKDLEHGQCVNCR